MQTAKALEVRLGQSLKPITMHWSGCPGGCGNHLVADIGLLGKKTKINGQVVEAVDIHIGGRSGPDPKPALKLLEDVPCDKLADVLGGIVPFHTREKMHRRRGTAAPGPGGGRKNGDPALAEAGGDRRGGARSSESGVRLAWSQSRVSQWLDSVSVKTAHA